MVNTISNFRRRHEGTLFKQGENFSGIIVMLMGSSGFKGTERGFLAMNEALKKRAEA